MIQPTLLDLDMYSPEAEVLILGTGLVESNLREIEQGRPGNVGPALGFFQMEPNTYYDLWKNYLDYRPKIEKAIMNTCRLSVIPKAEALAWNLRLACAMCRVHYWRVSERLPEKNDIRGMASYWKRHYNTHKGKGKIEHFIDRWENK